MAGDRDQRVVGGPGSNAAPQPVATPKPRRRAATKAPEEAPPPVVAAGVPAPEWAPPPWLPHPYEVPAFQSARPLARITVALLVLFGLIALAQAIHFIMGVEIQGRADTGRALDGEVAAFDDLQAWLNWVGLVVGVICGLAFVRWLWRSVANSIHLEAGYGLESPRDSAIAWLIPIYNLFRPCQIVTDLHDRLLAPLKSSPGRWLIRAWWAVGLAGLLLSFLYIYTAYGGAEAIGPDRVFALGQQGLGAGLRFADAFLAVAVVIQLQRLADARQAAQAGDPDRSAALARTTLRRRVAVLPSALAAVAAVALTVPLVGVYAGAQGGSTWITFQAPDGSFSVDFPRSPVELKVPNSSGGYVYQYAVRPNPNLVLAVSYLDSTGTADEILDGMEDGLTAMLTIDSSSDMTVTGFPAREIYASGLGLTVRVRLVVAHDRLYIVEADSTKGDVRSPDVDRFAESFTVR
jgi:hypothetical protein